jgi:hypothetical protein
MKVSIDHGEPVETPASVELSQGSHSVRTLESYLDNTYYVEQPEQSVLMVAGGKISTLVKAQAAKATLAIRGVPDGYDVFINDEKVGVTPLGQLTVKAGVLNIRFERSGESPRGMMIIARPNGTPTAFWGGPELPAQLQRRTIALNGNGDGWGGIVPLVDLSGSSSTFMGETGISIARVYMCRNDKDLFWRVDFNETNPLLKRPKGTDKGIACLLSFLYKPNEQFQLGEVYWKPSNSLHNWTRLLEVSGLTSNREVGNQLNWDRNETAGRYSQLLKNVDIRSYDKTLVGRVSLDEIADYCKGAVGVQVQLQNLNHVEIWAESQSTDIRYIDFSK